MNLNNWSDKIVFSSLKLIKKGHLILTNYDDEKYLFGDPSQKLKVKIKINKPGLTYQIVKSGSTGLAEAYMRGDFETDDLTNLIELTAKNIKLVYKFSGLLDFSIFNKIKNFLLKNDKSRSKKNISKHYDLGNEFFSLWLDPTLTYSSAIFDQKDNDLEKAQINKYKKLVELIKPKSGNKILEIGCGWGGFAEYVGKNHDVKLDCITISKKQFEYAKERIYRCGLNEKVKILPFQKNPYNLINSSDIFILTSIYEGLPNVLLEAQVLKKFIISTDCPTGPREILLNGNAGYLFKMKKLIF